MAFIGSVVVTPPQPRPGQSVRIEVLDPQGATLDGRADVQVTLNGVPGALQYLQLSEVRAHTVIAVATSGAVRERTTTTVTVAGEPMMFKSTGAAFELADVPLMRLAQSQTNPYVANFSLGAGFRHGAVTATRKRKRRTAAGTGPIAAIAARPTAARATAARRRTTPIASPLERELTKLAAARDVLPGTLGVRTTTARKVETRVLDLRDAAIEPVLAGIRATMKARYEWQFGDGTTAVTTVPYVTHDYFHTMAHANGPTRFQVRCVIAHQGNLEIRRTLNLVSAYGLCKARGTIVPHVTADLYAHKKYLWFSASLTVYNVEDTAITIDRQAVVPLSDDPAAKAVPASFVTLATPITLAPKSSTTIQLNLPIGGALHADAPGFTVYHAGHAADATPVRMTSIFEVPLDERDDAAELPRADGTLTARTWPWEEVMASIEEIVSHPGPDELKPQRVQVDKLTGTIATTWAGVRDVSRLRGARLMADRIVGARLAPAAKRNQTVERARPTLRVTSAITRAGSLAASVIRRVGGAPSPQPSPPPGPPPPPPAGAIKEGEVCDADNLTEAEQATAESKQLVCQLTGEIQEVMMPGRFMNARKGDVILSPGGTGLIGQLLRSVEPSQHYSHSGMMTRNYDEVTHSTASEEVLDDYIDDESPTDGLPENLIKYMWPGVVTQPVEGAVNGEDYTHPETGKAYPISSFSAHAVGVTHNGQFMMVPPLVVKPDPVVETNDIRTKLHGVADAARAKGYRPGGTPKSHYRLFCYTDPTIGQTTKAPASAGWAAHTFPSVCSSMIWMSAKEQGVRCESDQAVVMPSDLEAKDVSAGAFVNPGTPDGLYTYTAAERLAAGTWLYDTVYYMGYDAAGWFGEALTDAADDLANQLCNTFANDDANGQDSEAWRQQQDANAVSPDNILWWDAPAKGGLYGYSEPLIYREPRKEPFPISKWKKVLKHGDLSGTVKFKGATIAGANVRIYDGKTDLTNASGHYALKNVPLGNYQITASKVIDGKYCAISKLITLDAETQTVNLVLEPPAEDFRLTTVFFDFWGEDYEDFSDNEVTDPGAELMQIELGPDRLINTFSRTYKWGGELRAEYKFTLKLLVGNVIDVQVDCKLFEGTSETTDDLDGTGSLSFQVSMNQTSAATLRVWNTEEDEGHDQGILTVSVKNEQNNN